MNTHLSSQPPQPRPPRRSSATPKKTAAHRNTRARPSRSAAKLAHLRYVSDALPGIHRLAVHGRWKYVAPSGSQIRSARVLRRIQALAIPPAWTDVWICSDPHGHLQATGRDARGRKQHLYHQRWREIRDATKYHRLLAFGRALPRLRRRVRRDMARPGLGRAKVLATVVALLEKTLIRVGNEEYAKQNGSLGLTTLRGRNVEVSGAELRFRFRGKSGIQHEVGVRNRRLARIVKTCQDLPGQELFEYLDENGRVRHIDSADVNAYLREIMGEDFTAKDFRTWAATVLVGVELQRFAEPCRSASQAKRHINQAVDAVARKLGNTRAICRKSYIHPLLLERFLQGGLQKDWAACRACLATKNGRGWSRDEQILLQFLKAKTTARSVILAAAS